jgi:hypothetical protein
VAPRAFAISDRHVFVVVDNAIHRLPLEGAASGSPITLSGAPYPKDLTAAYAGETLLIGDANGPAQILADVDGATRLSGTYTVGDGGVISLTGLYGVRQVAENGTHFAVSLPGNSNAEAHLVAPSALERNPSPCSLAGNQNLAAQLASSGDTVGWVERMPMDVFRLHTERIVDGACTEFDEFEFGRHPSTALGLIDENFAVVVDSYTVPSVDVAVLDLRTHAVVGAPVANVPVGSGHPLTFTMGPPHHAVLLSQHRPALLAF